jgi:hypothetical protein
MAHDVRDNATLVVAEPEVNEDSENVWVWGADAIGRETNRTAAQVRYLYGIGFFKGAVWKAGHRTYVGNRQRLRNLVSG